MFESSNTFNDTTTQGATLYFTQLFKDKESKTKS